MFDTNLALAPTSSTLPTSAGVAIVMAYILDYVKRMQSIPKISYYTTKLNSWIRLAMATVGTVGISWTWSSLPGGGHQWVWIFPSATALLGGLWHLAVQYGAQHFSEIILALRLVARQAQLLQANSNSMTLKAVEKGISAGTP